MKTIPSILHENAIRWPDRPALIASSGGKDTTRTFAELEAEADDFAELLLRRGVQSGDYVLVFVPMSLELYTTLLGIFRIGATAIFIDPSAGISHINACCAELPIRAMIAVRTVRWLRPFVRGLRKIRIVLRPSDHSVHDATKSLPSYPDAETPALITFTSGSTGQPKAAVRSHHFLIAQHEALKASISLQDGERDLTTLPVFVLANLASGVTSILPDARISHPGSIHAARLAAQAVRLQPNRTGGSPAFYQRLQTTPDMLKGFRKIYMGGAPVFPSLLRAIQNLAPDADVTAVYGSTEAEPIAHISCREITEGDWHRMRSGDGLLAGKPVSEIRLRIVKDQWGESVHAPTALMTNECGEILVSGDHVIKGYLHGRGDSETKVSIDGEIWHRTGDAGYMDQDGRLWLLGRCSAAVHGKSGTIYPFAVECIAMTFPAVRRAAFVAIPDLRILAIELIPGSNASVELQSLRRVIGENLIDEIRTLPQIPVDRRHNAKVDYPALRKRLGIRG